VKEAMDAAGLHIPFPQREVTLVTRDQEDHQSPSAN
jgi:small-conductance mechanosensitive channel